MSLSQASDLWKILSEWEGKEKIRKENVRRKSQANNLIPENYMKTESKQKIGSKNCQTNKFRKLYVKDISENEDCSQAETFLTEVYFSAGKKVYISAPLIWKERNFFGVCFFQKTFSLLSFLNLKTTPALFDLIINMLYISGVGSSQRTVTKSTAHIWKYSLD